jgi:uncharacterized membrane protein YtjA (UPF0391 family)
MRATAGLVVATTYSEIRAVLDSDVLQRGFARTRGGPGFALQKERSSARAQRRFAMLHWAVVFFVVALVAALLGFRGVAGLSAEFGWVFVVLAVIFLAVGLLSGRTPPAVP